MTSATTTKCAALAATGLSNREIAGPIGVAIGAVKSHLREAIRKVGCYDRYGLAEAYGYPRPES